MKRRKGDKADAPGSQFTQSHIDGFQGVYRLGKNIVDPERQSLCMMQSHKTKTMAN